MIFFYVCKHASELFYNIDCKYRYILTCHRISNNYFYFEIKQNGSFKITPKFQLKFLFKFFQKCKLSSTYTYINNATKTKKKRYRN